MLSHSCLGRSMRSTIVASGQRPAALPLRLTQDHRAMNAAPQMSASILPRPYNGQRGGACITRCKEDGSANRRPRPERVEFKKKDWDLRFIFSQVDEGIINLEPKYQRDYVMQPKVASALCVTAILGLGMQAIMVHEFRRPDKRKVFDVVDGKQRLVSLYTFWKGKESKFSNVAPVQLTLSEEHYMFDELNGKCWQDLDQCDRDDFQAFSIMVQVIPETTPLDTVFLNYENINSGSNKHSKQQIRRAVFWENYIELLIELAASESGAEFRTLHNLTQSKVDLQEDQELILRFFAMYNAITSTPRLEVWKGRMSLQKFLNLELQTLGPDGNMTRKRLSPGEPESMTKRFTKTLELLATLDLADVAAEAGRPFQKTPYLVEMTMVALAVALEETGYKMSMFEQKAAALKQEYEAVVKNDLFLTSKLPSRETFKGRYDLLEGMLRTCGIGRGSEGSIKQMRAFPNAYQLKKKLYKANKTCAWCGERIEKLAHAELDHIQPYADGGKSDENNAQLLHTRCNRQKGMGVM